MLEASLSPRHLFQLARDGLVLDQPVFADYVLTDCYRLDGKSPLLVELRRPLQSGGHDRVEVEIEPVPSGDLAHAFPTTVAGLGLSYRRPVSAELGLAACEALGQVLRSALGEAPRRWQLLQPALEQIPGPICAEIECEPASLDIDPDRDLLSRDFGYYQRLYGVRPRALHVHPQGDPPHGVSVHYPAARNGRVPNSAAVYPAPTRISHRRRMRRYFASLGCSFDDEGVPRTVPTPSTYAEALADREGLATIRPRMLGRVWGSLSHMHWSALVRQGTLPVTVAPSWAVALHQRLRDIEPLSGIPCDVGMTVHDVGLHALALHAVPEAAWDELVGLALGRARKRPLSVLAGPWGVLARLALFFEGPVTRCCWDAWRDADEPEQFQQVFEPGFVGLCEQLREL